MGMTYATMRTRVIELGGYGTTDVDRIKAFMNVTKRDIESRSARWSWLEDTDSIVTVAGTATIALPADFNKHGRLLSTEAGVPGPDYIDALSFQVGSDDDSASTQRGVPVTYSIYGGNLVFKPIPDAAYTYTHRFWKFSPDLSGDSDTSPIPDTHEDVLIYGTLMHMTARDKNPQMMSYWQDMYEGRIRSLRVLDKMNQYDRPKKVPMPGHYHGSYDY